MKIGFTGTREGMTHQQKEAILSYLLSITFNEAHHGDCIGSDEQFHDLIRANYPNVKIIVHPPINPKYRAFCEGDITRIPEKYVVRDHCIVDETGIIIATPKGPEELHSGTWVTVRYAKKKNKPTYIIYPSGRVER